MGEKWRILCIDDDPEVRQILQLTLGTKHEVLVANDGMEGLGVLDIGDPDFVICDVMMPNLNGFQTVEAIRNHPRFYDIPVFFLTAETDRESAKRGFATGGNLYLTKPFDPMRILQNVDYFLKERALTPCIKTLTVAEVEEKLKRAPEPAKPSAPETNAAAARVIVLSHIEAQINNFSAAIKPHFECVTGADPIPTLQRLFRYDPDLLVINPSIPKLSGMGLVQMIRQNKKLRNLQILLIQGKGDTLDPRLLPAITKHPILPATASTPQILQAVRNVLSAPGFTISAKRMAFNQLMEEEDKTKKLIDMEKRREQKYRQLMRDRFSNIQDFIDQNR